MKASLRILLLEDDPRDAELIQELLEAEHFSCDVTRVETRADFLIALESIKADLILADYKLPSFDGISALKLALAARLDLPFIFVSGTIGEEVAIEAIKIGATDYVLKTHLSRLVPSVQRALREARERRERMKADAALRASEERFRDYADVASDWFWESGADHRFTKFSRTVASWGLLPADLIGKTRWDLAADRDEEPEKWRAHIATLDAHQPFRGLRYRITRSDGSPIYLSASGKPVFDGQGEFLGYRGLATDVSTEVRAEKALRESEERFRTLMQFSFDVYWETDAQHRFMRQDFSERVTDGPLPGSELGKRRWELPYLDIDEEAWRKHREMLDAHLPFRDLEYGRPTPNGGKRYAAISGLPMFDEAGRFIGYRGVGRHITERKRIEEALRQREKELREIVDTIPAMTVTIAPDGRDAFIGKRFSEYSGLSVEDARGFGWKVTVHPDDLDLYLSKWRPALMSGDPVEFETRVRRADGEYRWFLARAVAQKDEAGNVLKWYEVLTDIEDRKRAEQALRRSEAYLAEAQRLSHTGSFAYHPGRRETLFWSEELFRIFGLDPRHGIPDYDETRRLVHPDDLETVSATCLQGFREKAEFSQAYRLLLRDGIVKHLHAAWHPILDETGEVVEYVGTAADVTEREQAEQKFREREARIRRLIDANIIGIFIWDFDGRIIEANDAFLTIVGYDREDLVADGIRWTDLTPSEWHDLDARLVEEIKLTGRLPPFEKEYFRKNGSRVPVLIGVTTLEEGGTQGIAFVLDLTERKRAEAALRESEEQWKAVFENNPVMYFMVDADGAIVSVNPFGAEQLGYTVDELIGRPVQMVFHEADREAAQRNAAICFNQPGRALSWELRKVRKSGEMIWVRETARASLIKNRSVLLIVCEDITEGKHAAKALSEVQTELAHANRVAALGQLTASIAHEVNQPVTGALSSGHAALRWLERSNLEAARRAIERVIRDATRAGEVISGVRTFFKKAPSHEESFDINEAIREVVVIIGGEAAKNGVSVETQLTEDLPLVVGLRVGLQQVILNLVINAIEAMSGASGPRELVIRTTKSEPDSVSVTVQDSGPGLDPASLERAFEAFYTTKPDGLGMGLSICRSIIEAHGRKLAVTANVPHGAVFQFTVPAHGKTAHAS